MRCSNKEDFIKALMDNIEKVLAKRTDDNKVQEIATRIEALKEELKGLIKLNSKGQIDIEVYIEENNRISHELKELRNDKAQIEREYKVSEGYKERVNEIIAVLDSMDGLLEEFDEVLSPRHLIFVLKSGMRVEEVL